MEKNNLESTKSFKPIFVQDEMSSSYLSYAMSVIVSRALPDVRAVSYTHLTLPTILLV